MLDLIADDSRKYHVCYECKEVGYYANNCPNPKKPHDYVPLCGNYRMARM
jgi:hypothetical protein